MTTRLRNALAAGEFVLHWQPVFSLADDKLVSVEALLRWDDPERGLVTAAEFIPMAEQMGLIERIDAWVVDAIARQARAWREEGLEPARVVQPLRPRPAPARRCSRRCAEKLSAGDLDPRRSPSRSARRARSRRAAASTARCASCTRPAWASPSTASTPGLSSLRRLRDLPLTALKIDGVVRRRRGRGRGGGVARHRHHRLRDGARRDRGRRGRRDRGAAPLPDRQRLPDRPGLPPGAARGHGRDDRVAPSRARVGTAVDGRR